jgi:ethanolamine ammonia-lyase small subunit
VSDPAPGADLAKSSEIGSVTRSGDDLARRAVTPARVLLGRTGLGYRTSTQLRLRADHAAARDALSVPLDLQDSALTPLARSLDMLDLETRADSLATHLARPDLGRRLSADSVDRIRSECPRGVDLQIVIGDGLSPQAVLSQVPTLLPLLMAGAAARGLSTGQVVFVRHCRVGVLNDIGDALESQAVVLLIGERPGLATAESLSAYLAWQPRSGHTDADRNLISNIHADGVDVAQAAVRIVEFAGELRLQGRSGFTVKEPPRPGTGLPARER